MTSRRSWGWMAAFLLSSFLIVGSLTARALSQSLYQGMRWRLVGPFRGGRVEAVAGIPGNPLV
ncbi:MAG: hypothetical protein WBF46_16410, partial [Candidatus Acidiferrales bacterium]